MLTQTDKGNFTKRYSTASECGCSFVDIKERLQPILAIIQATLEHRIPAPNMPSSDNQFSDVLQDKTAENMTKPLELQLMNPLPSNDKDTRDTEAMVDPSSMDILPDDIVRSILAHATTNEARWWLLRSTSDRFKDLISTESFHKTVLRVQSPAIYSLTIPDRYTTIGHSLTMTLLRDKIQITHLANLITMHRRYSLDHRTPPSPALLRLGLTLLTYLQTLSRSPNGPTTASIRFLTNAISNPKILPDAASGPHTSNPHTGPDLHTTTPFQPGGFQHATNTFTCPSCLTAQKHSHHGLPLGAANILLAIEAATLFGGGPAAAALRHLPVLTSSGLSTNYRILKPWVECIKGVAFASPYAAQLNRRARPRPVQLDDGVLDFGEVGRVVEARLRGVDASIFAGGAGGGGGGERVKVTLNVTNSQYESTASNSRLWTMLGDLSRKEVVEKVVEEVDLREIGKRLRSAAERSFGDSVAFKGLGL